MTPEEIEKQLSDLDARMAKVAPVWQAAGAEIELIRKRREYLNGLLASGKEPPTTTEIAMATNEAVDAFMKSPVIPLEGQPL